MEAPISEKSDKIHLKWINVYYIAIRVKFIDSYVYPISLQIWQYLNIPEDILRLCRPPLTNKGSIGP